MRILTRSLEIARALHPLESKRKTYHWSFAWNKNQLIGIETNKPKTNPLNRYNLLCGFPIDLKGTCSELALFIKLKNTMNINWSKIKIVNVKIGRNGLFGCAAPCSSCSNLLKFINPSRLFYSTESSFEEYSLK